MTVTGGLDMLETVNGGSELRSGAMSKGFSETKRCWRNRLKVIPTFFQGKRSWMRDDKKLKCTSPSDVSPSQRLGDDPAIDHQLPSPMVAQSCWRRSLGFVWSRRPKLWSRRSLAQEQQKPKMVLWRNVHLMVSLLYRSSYEQRLEPQGLFGRSRL